METLIGKHWHHLPSEEVLDLLETDPERGLGTFEIQERQKHFGSNVLAAKKGRGPILRFLLQFHQPLVYILLAAGITTGLVAEWSDAAAIFGVVLVNAIIGTIQEAKAAGAIEALAKSMSTGATVLRGGQVQNVSSVELVPGDVVLLQSGDKVPADMRLLQAREFRVDESALTGESIPVDKLRETLPHDTVLADRRNMAYASTLVTYGQGKGVVVAIGSRTEMGRISRMIAEADVLETPLTRKISHFSKILLVAILGLGALTFGAGLLHGEPIVEMFMAAVALTVGAIPEGLPAAVTIILAVGVSRMARRRAIIRRLPAVETLGSTTVICSDKTGTLTENQMTVREILAGGGRYGVSGGGYESSGTIARIEPAERSDKAPALVECLQAGLLCSDARLVRDNGKWAVEGDPTEGALIVSARKLGLAEEAIKAAFPRVDAIPFESEHQYMATLHAAGGNRVAYVKGSLEAVLARCATALDGSNREGPLDADRIRSEADAMSATGMRVLAFARGTLPPGTNGITHEDVASGLSFVGLQGMIDPPRAEAVAAVKACQGAGVRVKMITGDHALTALAIARQIGIAGDARGSEAPVITGKELARLSDEELIDTAGRMDVFARVAPEQKLRLVKALQARGNVIAMTGDGVNDAPALKQADIGIAMGITGTEVSKEAADMILTDDNFASIEAAVEEGRCVFDNLVKFLVWALPTNLGQGLVILAAVLAGVELPILPVQSLWINMTTAGSLGLMLAFEPKEAGLMARPPRSPQDPILPGALLWRIVLVGVALTGAAFALFEWEELAGSSHAQARTVAVNAFAVISGLYLLNSRSLSRPFLRTGPFSNRWVLLGIVAMGALQLLFTYSPPFNRLFHSAPIDPASWARIVGSALVIHLIVNVEKWRYRRRLP